ncbi:hypothetical protein ACIA8K_12440 [Catenuloplanes sp. NPDC051500]|uniref:hypothetical protein n=1 Tax=Catenuloplanes sp. NPDC051500 TaxID=3363959 RepID=UPI0037A26367
MTPESFARGIAVTLLGVGAGYISLGHVYTFVLEHSAPGTPAETGIIVAAVSELMPIGVALHARVTGKLNGWAISLLLLAGAFSLWAQVATAGPGVTGVAVAAFPTLAFMGLVKLILSKAHVAVPAAPVETIENLLQTAAVRVDQVIEIAAVREALEAEVIRRAEMIVQQAAEREAEQAEARPEPGGTLTHDEPEPSLPQPSTSGGKKKRAASPDKAARIIAARRELGPNASQEAVGDLSGFSASTVSRFEAALRKVDHPATAEPASSADRTELLLVAS